MQIDIGYVDGRCTNQPLNGPCAATFNYCHTELIFDYTIYIQLVGTNDCINMTQNRNDYHVTLVMVLCIMTMATFNVFSDRIAFSSISSMVESLLIAQQWAKPTVQKTVYFFK